MMNDNEIDGMEEELLNDNLMDDKEESKEYSKGGGSKPKGKKDPEVRPTQSK